MKKLVLCLSLCAMLIGLFCGCTKYDADEKLVKEEQYFSKINEIIKDLEFDTAKAKDGKIMLYNEKNEPISEISFKDYDSSINFIYAYKKGVNVYFVQNRAVDDEWGIMFVNDGSDDMMDGIWHADKISGNSYEYSTIK